MMASVSQKTVQNYGIEVNEGIRWQVWEPGGEYTKQITLKNVQVKTQKIIYKVPGTRFFTTLYPKPVILTCGTSFTLPVTFRPLEKSQYEDKIEFQTKDGTFAVPIKAVLPEVDLLVPERLTFGMCAVKDTMELSFKLTNPSDVHTGFTWSVQEPFSLQPSNGNLAPKTSCLIRATFSPKSAFVYNAFAVCQFGDITEPMEKSVELDGIGKYPYIMVKHQSNNEQNTASNPSETLLQFATVAAGFSAEKTIHLYNLSPVNASFQVLQPSSISNLERVFTCSQYHGIIAPQSTAKIKVQYAPSYPGATHVDYFEVNVLGATNCSIIKCVGKSKGPCVNFDNSSLGFGQVRSGGTVTRILNITNDSDVNTAFQFLIDKANSVFTFEKTSGYLPAGITHSIIAPLILEVFGTCHTELVQPAVLQEKHITQSKLFVKRGLSRTSSDQLNEMFKEGKLNLDENGVLNNPPTNDVEMSEEDLTSEEQFFNDTSIGETAIVQPHISLDHSQLNFGKCSSIPCVEQKTINITNHTKGKVTCNWMKDVTGVFEISPENVDILPLKTASFTVTFKPDRENQFYGCGIECFVSYKCARDYRLVEDKTLSPPWCVTAYFSGETFSQHRESFLPRLEFNTTQLVFPAVAIQNTSYRTLLISNSSSNPVNFCFDRDLSGTFRCKPSRGIIKDNLQLVMFRYEAIEMQTNKLPLCCHFNNEEKFNQEFTLVGSTESPKIHLEQEIIYFRPTCVGNSSKRSFKVQNRSRAPVSFEWKTRKQDSSVLEIEPCQGTMQPGEHQSFVWSFCPVEEKKYLIKCKLFVNVGELVTEVKNVIPNPLYLLRAVGSGLHGNIVCTHASVDFENVVVGTSVTRKITLCNPSDCDVPYRLLLSHENNEKDDDNTVISLDDVTHGVLPARTNKCIQLHARPRRRTTYKTNVNYQVISLQEKSESGCSSETLCCVSVQGVYPTLTVRDIRATGSGEAYSKSQLWKLFSLESFNAVLESDPQPVEAMSSATTRYSDRRRKPVSTRAVVGFSFGSAGRDSESTVFYLSLMNSGSVPAEWSFLFPNDVQLELEYWAETGEYSSEELHQMQTIGHHLFSVEPSCGTLAGGHAQTVALKYKHSIVGINRLPVLFKITRGREVLLNFTGVTVEADQPFVHFSSTNFMFAPVPVGLSTPPIQDYALYNGGSVNATYEIDLSPLEHLNKENYGCEIFTCLNATGTIAPGKTAVIHWVFEPLEAKTYIIDIPIRVLGCETTWVTFTGIGYDHRVMGKTLSLEQQIVDIPAKQIASVSSQLASLSEERVHFGRVPLFTKKTKVIFILNKHSEHTISYRWMLDNSPEQNVVEIHPQYGIVKPHGSVVLKITFFSSGSPSLHDIDLVCEITDDTLMNEYNVKFEKWSALLEEQKHTFTITEKDIADEALKKPKTKDVNDSMKRLSKSEGDLKKFTTLPPIGSGRVKNRARSGNGQIKSNAVPLAPRPFLLHLSVTAQTLEAGDVHIDRDMLALTSAMMRKHTFRSNVEKETAVTSSSREELRVVTEALSIVLRGLLDDENFHADIKSLNEEPIPYFKQFQSVTMDSARDTSCSDVFHYDMDNDIIYSSLKNIPILTISPNTPTVESVSSGNEVLGQTSPEEDMNLVNNEIKSSAEFATLAEAVLENTIYNLMWEASLGEVNLTARPRVIALPPSRGKTNL